MTRWILIGISTLALIAMICCAIVWPAAVAAGWLVGFVFWAAIPIGALGLSLIWRLTGGAWGLAIAPARSASIRELGFVWLAIVPVLIAIPVLFVWAHGHGARPDVRANYLNWPFYVGRSVVILSGLSVLGIWERRQPGSRALAAGGLIFYAVALSVAAIDWILAVYAGTYLSAMGPALATEYMTAALAWSLLTMPEIAGPARADLSALLLTGILFSAYFNYMDFMVLWYGDVPAKITWYLPRANMPWKLFAVAGILLGAVIPALLLIFGRTRRIPELTRSAAASVLFGYACWQAWRILPAYGIGAIPFAITALVGMGTFVLWHSVHRYRPMKTGRAHA